MNHKWSSKKTNNEWFRNEIKTKLVEINPDNTSSQKIALHAGILFRFLSAVKEKDIIFVPDKDKLHLAQVMGSYIYSTKDGEKEYPHQRKVRWIKKDIDRKSIPSFLQKSLSSKLTLYSISDNYDKIMEFIREVVPEEHSEDFKPSYEYLKEAVYIEVMKKHSRVYSPQQTIYELAMKNISRSTIERAKQIADKVKVFCGNGMWQDDIERYLFDDEFWISEIMDWIEEDRFDEAVEEEKKRLFNEAEKELKEALDIAKQEDNMVSLTETIQSLEEKEKRIEDFRTIVIDRLMNKIDEKKRGILQEANKEFVRGSLDKFIENASEEEIKKFVKRLKDEEK